MLSPRAFAKAFFSSFVFAQCLFQFQYSPSLGLAVPEVTSASTVSNVMALDKFLGKWLENRKEGFQLLADALGESRLLVKIHFHSFASSSSDLV